MSKEDPKLDELIKVSSEKPKLKELYKAVIDDCYLILNGVLSEAVINSIKKQFGSKINETENIIFSLRFYISNNLSNLKSEFYLDLISFSLLYINNIELFIKKKTDIIIKSIDEFCLSYIAIVGFRCSFTINFQDKELFLFNTERYTNFSKLLEKYGILKEVEKYYEENSVPIWKNENNIINKYFDLILKFDTENRFVLLKKKEEENKITEKGKTDMKKKDSFDSQKEKELNSTKYNSGKKENNHNKVENNNEIKYENNTDINTQLNLENNKEKKESLEIKKSSNKNNDKIDESNLRTNNEFVLTQDNNKINLIKKNYKDENQINEKENEVIKKNEINLSTIYEKIINMEVKMKENELKVDDNELNFQLKIELLNIDSKLELLEIDEKINYQSLLNSALLKIEKKKNEYLDKYIQFLKNIVINLSNPNNFNYWRKIVNIILKKKFIALKIKGFSLEENLEQKIYKKLKSYQNKIVQGKREEYDKKCDNYQTQLNIMKNQSKSKNISSSEGKERSDNLITISKKGNDYLKEKGNQFNHFDENLLNILFNELNIIDEENKIIIKEDQAKEIKDERKNEIIIKEGNVMEIKVENGNEKLKKEEKSEKIKDKKGKTNSIEIQGNQKKVEEDKTKEINVEEMKQNETNIKINEMQNKEEKYENNLDENKSEVLKIEKIKAEEMNLFRKYEGKSIFTEDELINKLKNPLIFNKNQYKKMNFFDQIYNMIDELKKDIGCDDSLKQLSELERKAKVLNIECKELILNIETYFLNNEIDINNIEEIIKNENTNQNTKIKGMIYLELLKLQKKLEDKIIKYKDINKKFLKLNDSVTFKEKEVNKYIDEIKRKLAAANLIKLSDFFNQYKFELREKKE